MRRILPVHDKNWVYYWQFLQDMLITTGVSSLMDFNNTWIQREQKRFSIQSDFDGASEMVQ